MQLCARSLARRVSSLPLSPIMSAYLRSWLTGVPAQTPTQPNDDNNKEEEEETEVSVSVAPPEASDEDEDADSDATDTPPAFPSLNSAQRMSVSQNVASPSSSSPSSSSPLPKVLTDAALMPPPPAPASALRVPGVPSQTSRNGSNGLKPPPTLSVSGATSGSGSLMPPPTTTKIPVKKAREKVALAPGYGPLEWAALKSSGKDLRVRILL